VTNPQNGDAGWAADFAFGQDDPQLDVPACGNLPGNDPTPPYPAYTLTYTPTITATPTRAITLTPTSTPSPQPRDVAPEASPFHQENDRLGLPAPFHIWPRPVDASVISLVQYGFGPNQNAQSLCDKDPVDPYCQYSDTAFIHTGLDYITEGDRKSQGSSPPLLLMIIVLVQQ
jgi:hypothetical protein